MNTLSLNKPFSMPALQLTPWVFVIQRLPMWPYFRLYLYLHLRPDQEGSWSIQNEVANLSLSLGVSTFKPNPPWLRLTQLTTIEWCSGNSARYSTFFFGRGGEVGDGWFPRHPAGGGMMSLTRHPLPLSPQSFPQLYVKIYVLSVLPHLSFLF